MEKARILIIDSWAKGHITLENLKQFGKHKVYAYMEDNNPGMIKLADGYKLGSLYDIKSMVDYAKEIKADIVIPTTAGPLEKGIIDLLKKNNIRGFGPLKTAARLETNKAFTRELMKKYSIPGAPDFSVFDVAEEAIRYAKKYDWNVAVKPTGLTEGLGVKVFGDQLKNSDQVKNYIMEVLKENIGGSKKVLIEQKISGSEFTIQCMIKDDKIIPTPAVQDFKKLNNGEKGPNTASMGSYSTGDYILPFMFEEDYNFAVEIMRKTIKSFKKETGVSCKGFLYGQFMITEKGIKLIEYNFRPGDPEWMNTIFVIKNDIGNVIIALEEGYIKELEFEKKATVCKYLVPPGYPQKLNQDLKVKFKEEEIKKQGVGLYYSCGKKKEYVFPVGSERGIALISKSEDIEEAYKKIENTIKKFSGDFHYRKDIGSKSLIREKTKEVNKTRIGKLNFRKAEEEDFLDIYNLVSNCPPLEYYYEHVYKILLRYFSSTCFILEYNKRIVSVVIGFISQEHEPKTYFLWQIGVSPKIQGIGVGSRMLKYIEKELKKINIKQIEVTIDPKNIPSQKIFERNGYNNISKSEGKTVEIDGNIAVKDYYSPGAHFMLYNKKL